MHFRPLRDDFMDSESESDGVLDTPVPSITQASTPPPSDSPVNIVPEVRFGFSSYLVQYRILPRALII